MQGATQSMPVPAARQLPREGPQRGSSAALEALLSSPRASDPSFTLSDRPAALSSPLAAPTVSTTLTPLSGDATADGGDASTAALQSLSPLSPVAGDRGSVSTDTNGVVGAGGVLKEASSVPDTPTSPFMSAQRDLAGLAPVSVSSFDALRSAPHNAHPC